MSRSMVVVAGQEITRGSRVRVRPCGGADIFDLVLAGRTATVETIEEDMDGKLHLVVRIDDDPGRDLGARDQLGHRFFFGVDEIDPLAEQQSPSRLLVAGIGNVFHGDDGFGVEVVRRLATRPIPAGVDVVDFGIRGMDLMYALQDGYQTVVLVDTAPRGDPPGTVSLIEPEAAAVTGPSLDGHGMNPVQVLRLARQSGAAPGRVLLVACEPSANPQADWHMGLSAPVDAAVDEALRLIVQLIEEGVGK